MSPLAIFLVCLGAFLLLGLSLYLYGYFFEVKKTKILRFQYQNKQLTKIKKPIESAFKIVFFSDLHVGKMLKGKQLEKKVEVLKQCQADLYLFGGDLIGYNTAKYFQKEDIEKYFQFLKSQKGYKVEGNHEYKKESRISQNQKDALFEAFPLPLLQNEAVEVKYHEKKIVIMGLKEGQYHTPQQPNISSGDIRIVVVHQGDYFDQIHDVDLVLSGHTHGGQIRIPFLPLIYKPKHGKKYIQGVYQKDNQYLIVSKGMGCNMFKFRFCAPSDIIELYITD